MSTTTIPQIAVTPHDEENDNDNNTNYLCLAEALTDVEDLYEDGDELIIKKQKPVRKSKLKIKLVQDDALTDLEDFEASDDDNDKNHNIVMHADPISLDDLDLEGGVFEESYNTHVKTPKGVRKLKSQCSTTQRHVEDLNYKVFDNYTDEEIFDSEHEIAMDAIPENTIDLDKYNLENMNVADSINRDDTKMTSISPHSDPSDSLDSEHPVQSNQFLSAMTLSPNLSDLTDIEVLHSDSDDDQSFKKTKQRRRRHKAGRRQSLTDVEDLHVSDGDDRFRNYVSNPRRKVKKVKIVTQSHSLAYDSDNDDDAILPFPICKKIAEKNQHMLNIPEFDTNFPTDVEDFEEDVTEDIETPVHEAHEEAFEKKLEEMAECYSKTDEAHSSIKNKKMNKTDSFKNEDVFDKGNSTDSDNYESDNCISDKNDKEESVHYDIKFVGGSSKELKKNKITLLVPSHNEEPVTDCENVNSSDEDVSNIIPVALAKEMQALTDEEEFQYDSDETNNFPEIILPPPVRNLVILKENETLPTVQILPLIEEETPIESPQEQSVNAETDEESVSEAEEAVEIPTSISVSDFTLPDCGVVKETENKPSKSKRLVVQKVDDAEALTDTEELVLTTQKRRRAPKFKHLHERFMAEKNKLSVKTPEPKGLTDTEDINLSDGTSDHFHSLSPLLNLPAPEGGITDTEVLLDSSDEEPSFRAMSCTPQQLRELGGEMIMSKEGSGPFSLQDRLKINKPIKMASNVIVSPVNTDSEDLGTSADEDTLSYSRAETLTPNQIHFELNQESSTKILTESKRKLAEGCMYLKGGGYIDHCTDSEYVSAEEGYFNAFVPFQKDSCKISFNLRDGSMSSFGIHEGWEATRSQPLNLEPTAPTLVKDAAQQGGDSAASSSSTRETAPSSSSRPEGEEGAEKEESGYERGVADQHQLSEEMKELLKELEKESKQ